MLPKGSDLVATKVESYGAPAAEGRGDRRLLAALCLSSFLAALNFFALSPFYAVIARDLDTTVPLLGQVTTLMILISAALGLAVGPLADRYGYRNLLVIGVLAVSVALIGVGLAPSYPILLGLSMLGGLADALLFGLPLAIAGSRFHGDAQRTAMGWTIGSLSAAPIIGIPILTTIGSVSSWRVALVAAGALSALATFFIGSAIPADSGARTGRIRFQDLSASYGPLLRHRGMLRLYGATAARAMMLIGLIAYLGAFLDEGAGLNTRQVGFVFMAAGVSTASGNLLGGRVLRRAPRRWVLGSCLVSAIAMTTLFTADNIGVVLPLLTVATLAGAIAGLGITTLLASESRSGTGTTMVLNGSLLNFGAAAGAGLGGLSLGLGGYPAMAFALSVFGVFAGILTWWPNRV